MKLSIISGGFDPVHVGHLECFERARKMADDLFVIINDDKFLERKKGKPFMAQEERTKIVGALKPVTMPVESLDLDDTVCKTLEWLHGVYKGKYNKIMFCNGGDRVEGGDTPEHDLCLNLGIEPIYGLGEKIQSSSWLISGKAKASQRRQSDVGSLFF